MYNNLKKTINILKKSKKIKCFFFGNTVKKEQGSFYLTGIRENQKFIYSGAIIFNDTSAKKIAKIVDGNVDFVLVDTEKKTISKRKKIIVNIEKSVKNTIKLSNILTYKGNDLTVQAADTFINNFFLKDIRGEGGKKILILVAGNIGVKLGLKLVESGANIYLYRRRKKILKKIVNAINSVIPKGTKAKVKELNSLNSNLGKFKVIVGCTSGKSILTSNHVDSFKQDTWVIDIGKGIFQEKALKKALANNMNLYRLDITPAYNAYLENIETTQKLYNFNLKKSQSHGKLKLVKRGMLTDENSIIVDNVNLPKKIYGISDGYGGFKKIQQNTLSNLQKKIKFDN